MGEAIAGGGPDGVRLVDVRDTPLSVDEVLAAVSDPRAGGIAIFVGTVRSHDDGRDVDALDYEAHPGAIEAMRAIADGIAQRPEVIALAAVHRVGPLAIGDLAVVVAASTAHRHDAFRAGQDLIDAIKENVPIWKRQVFRDGEIEWVGALG
jgi:molybdopterin synthase catalytic subunit